MKIMKKLQIGVMGSAADLNYSKELEQIAFKLGQEIAKNNAILIFGAEKDCDSLSTSAARGAKSENGLTVGITYEKGKDIYEKEFTDVIIPCGMVRGGGRELALILSCDVVIAIAGGSGTLTEIAIAYQANIPVVVLNGYGGWSDKLADTFIDERKRFKIEAVKTPQKAVEMAIGLVK